MKLPSVVLSVAALALLVGCSRPEDRSASAPVLPPVRVQTGLVRLESVSEWTEITGTVRPMRRATLAAKVMGSIEELPASLGQRFHAGDLLLKISAGEIAAKLAQAQAQLDQANRDYARERDLLPKNASTPEMVRNLETRVTLFAAMVREAEAMMSYAIIRAPFDCTVARKYVEAGDLALPGVPLLEIEGLEAFQVEAGIPDSLAGALTLGAIANISVESVGATFAAPLTELSSATDANAHTVMAKFSVPAGATVRSGQFARVQVPGAAVRLLLAPRAAVSQLGQMERVFVVGEGKHAVLRLVKTGAVRGDRIEILSGLDDGESLVLAPSADLQEGQLLEVQP